MKDMGFIKAGVKIIKDDKNIEIDKDAISEEELRMYKTLDQAYKKINQFQVE